MQINKIHSSLEHSITDPRLHIFYVEYEDKLSNENGIFSAYAESETHAVEQYENAYPKESFDYRRIGVTKVSNTYSFRAECSHDVNTFFKNFNKELIVTRFEQPNPNWSDVEVEFRSVLSMEELNLHLNAQDDSHVISDTLRDCELKDNPLDRRPL